MVFDALAGPPSVMIQTRSNNWREPTTARKIHIRIVGPRSGNVMWRTDWRGVAPSSAAASRNSGGIP